ncbi:hypothetical protein F2Q69_00020282 [Brassica cretica]|uniref:Uncharacterized protein n=1 Tax=Brassica cretica TaxID=69181 RepID=A0A8S9QCN1_BRACR|nr:hypothetical protein F2Q69_00020282 [Brassica cretica]
MNALFINGGRRSVWREMKRKFGSLTASSSSSSDTCTLWGSPLRGSFPWARSGSGPLHPGGLYLGWIEPSTALVSRRGRVVFARRENRTRMVVATTGPSCHLDYLVRTMNDSNFLLSILISSK